jgi:RNA polymerase sigma-70 factor, ECF subfamily
MDIRSQLPDELPYLRRFARSLARDPILADDLVQDCVEKAIAGSHTYDPARPLRAWLYAILRNTFISDRRKNLRLVTAKSVDDLAEHEGATAPEQESGLALNLINTALNALPAQQREVIALVSIEGLSYKEVAEIIGVPIGTIMSRLSRARNQLQEILEQQGHSVVRRAK